MQSLLEIPLNKNEFEILFVDDLSTDNSVNIIKSFIKEYSNVRLIQHRVNKRQGGAKNTGIAYSKGDYIVFIDQDDTIIPFANIEFYQQLKTTDLDVYSFRFKHEVMPNVWQEKGIDLTMELIEPGKDFCEKYANPAVSFSPWSYWFKREYLLDINLKFAENVMWEDADWVAQAIFYAKKIGYFPIPIYNWHYNVKSISNTNSPFTLADRILMGYRKYLFARKIEQVSFAFYNVMLADALWNIGAIKKLWKLSPSDIIRFYGRLKSFQMNDIECVLPTKEKFLFYYHSFAFGVLSPISILYKLVLFLKK
jgi:glycosyltransferase involved in cell wall biosynthesis